MRVRPLNAVETDGNWKYEDNVIYQDDSASGTKYVLDHVFPPSQSTAAVYEATTKSLIKKTVSGFNSTIFAYGQTSSGKTFTMRGSDQEPGIITLAVSEIFSIIEQTTDREFLLRVSYMEVCLSAWLCTAPCMHKG